MKNGKAYQVKLDELPQADESAVARVMLDKSRSFVTVFQESGNQFEVPWDTVLYYAEPTYQYYKGREAPAKSLLRAVRIGAAVGRARIARGLSVTELAERAGMKRPNLSRLEHGRQQPALETLERIAEALGLPVAVLVSADEPRTSSPTRGR